VTHRFEVWAPDRKRVELVIAGRRAEMSRREGGWWTASDAGAGPGTRYGFALDGGDTRPDPRSPSQPDGVLGLSEVVDHGVYRWTDGEWRGRALEASVIYELHVGTFTPRGTFEGVIDKLPYLVELGVDVVELMPVAEFSGNRGWGYDGVDLFAPHHAYGGPDGLKRLVGACHTEGLAVILDVVYNHLGPAGNFLSEFGPYFSEDRRTFWGEALNFDGDGSKEVRALIVDNAAMWIRDYHLDGLRLDAVQAIDDHSHVHLVEAIATEVHRLGDELGRSTVVTAESNLNEPRLVRGREAGGYGLDAAWADDWHHAVHTVLTGDQAGYYADFGSLAQLRKALRQAWVFDGKWSPRRQKVRGGPVTGLQPHSFVISLQNHDQVGNRAIGDRLGAQLDEGRLKIAAALLLTSPFTPLLFQGEEWAAGTPFQYFTDHADPELQKAVSEGRRREFAAFGWKAEVIPDPQDPATYARSKLRWEEIETEPHREMLEWYRGLIAMRRRLPSPNGGRIEVEVDEEARHLSLARDGIAVRANLGESYWFVELGEGARLAMASDAAIREDGGSLCLPPSSVAILETKPSIA
jgi:maltooligosyltrehalose trehalohydrolase